MRGTTAQLGKEGGFASSVASVSSTRVSPPLHATTNPARVGWREQPGGLLMMPATISSRSGSEHRQRSARPAQMRLTEDEWSLLRTRAADAGLTVSAYMRHQCLGAAGPRAVRRPPIVIEMLSAIMAQLGKCGSNLNQIAKKVNYGGQMPLRTQSAVDAFEEACVAVVATLRSSR